MMQIIKDVLTREDGTTYDEVRVMGSVVLIFGCLLCFWLVVVKGDAFDANAFFWGSAGVLSVMAGGPAGRDLLNRIKPNGEQQ